MSQQRHNFAIVDEVDSILIDEARTPLIISGPAQDRSEMYVTIDCLIPSLTAEHYDLDEKTRNVTFTDEGNEFLRRAARRVDCWKRVKSFMIPKARQLCTTSIRGCGRTSCFRKTKTTSFATTRSC